MIQLPGLTFELGESIEMLRDMVSKTTHEGLHVGDFYAARWKAGSEVVRFQDDIYKYITPVDLKQ
ncbi:MULTISPECIES: hypothetical protein [unclassified Burkholderia]|uniref:hypothetical protein n=1 Tax=unclassified Burkholderia TaxID=2613784 RepID=UPI0021502F94|nr:MULTISPECIES: hypothetical protein [unclassified Burkholderia]MCR4471572.1 hypothetical protein [Burkholderia sp. SCN-KJ]